MNRRILLAYQILTGLSDTATGLLLIFAPALTLSLMGLHVAAQTMPFLSYIGAFVLSVGIACFYGASLAAKLSSGLVLHQVQLETVWLLTGITRAVVAVFVAAMIASGALEPGWSSVALTDGLLALLQFVGLARGWVRRVQ